MTTTEIVMVWYMFEDDPDLIEHWTMDAYEVSAIFMTHFYSVLGGRSSYLGPLLEEIFDHHLDDKKVNFVTLELDWEFLKDASEGQPKRLTDIRFVNLL